MSGGHKPLFALLKKIGQFIDAIHDKIGQPHQHFTPRYPRNRHCAITLCIVYPIMPKGTNYSMEEVDNLLDLIKDILPLSTTQWEEIAKHHLSR